MHVDRRSVVIDGRDYEWSGGFGAVMTSRERGVRKGDVRMINGRLFYAFLVTRDHWLRPPQISWSTVEKTSVELVRAVHQEVFG